MSLQDVPHQRVGTTLRAMALKNLGEVTLRSTRPLPTGAFVPSML